MLSRINNNQPAFKGMYIIKGKAKNVKNAAELIYNKCGSELNRTYDRMKHNNVSYFPILDEVRVLNLTDMYDENQPMAHVLIATNEHTPNIDNWRKTMTPPMRDKLKEKLEELTIERTPFGVIISGDIYGIAQEIQTRIRQFQEKAALYIEAKEAAKRGNDDLMCDFLIDSMMKMKQRLQEIRNLATVPYDNPEIIKATEVLKAIKEEKFNFITGEIKK